MKLIPITREHVTGTAAHWLPFIPKIAQRSHESVEDMLGQVRRYETRLVLVWDDASNKAVALIGIRLVRMNGDIYGDWIWMAGSGRHRWEHLLPELETLLREAGCVACRPVCRPGWSKLLQKAGYKTKHMIMEKPL